MFFLKNRDPDRWSDVKSVNAVQIKVGKMSDTQLLEELRSDPNVYATITSQMPELEKIAWVKTFISSGLFAQHNRLILLISGILHFWTKVLGETHCYS